MLTGWSCSSQLCLHVWHLLGFCFKMVVPWKRDDCGKLFLHSHFHSCKMFQQHILVCPRLMFILPAGSPWWQKWRRRHPNATKDPTYVWSLGWLQHYWIWGHHLTRTACDFCTEVCTTTTPLVSFPCFGLYINQTGILVRSIMRWNLEGECEWIALGMF